MVHTGQRCVYIYIPAYAPLYAHKVTYYITHEYLFISIVFNLPYTCLYIITLCLCLLISISLLSVF